MWFGKCVVDFRGQITDYTGKTLKLPLCKSIYQSNCIGYLISFYSCSCGPLWLSIIDTDYTVEKVSLDYVNDINLICLTQVFTTNLITWCSSTIQEKEILLCTQQFLRQCFYLKPPSFHRCAPAAEQDRRGTVGVGEGLETLCEAGYDLYIYSLWVRQRRAFKCILIPILNETYV